MRATIGPAALSDRIGPGMTTLHRRCSLALLLAIACSAPRAEAPPAAARISQAALTPGMCGFWEQTDSAALDGCRRALLRNPAPGFDSIFPGDCGYEQFRSLDSLRACLRRTDSAASACPLAGGWRVRQSDGAVRATEWRRCGPQGGAYEGDSIVYPLHYLLLRRDTGASSPAIFSYSNADEPGAGGLDTVMAADLDADGTDEVFYVDRIYGTGAIFEFCALAVFGGKLRCWTGPDLRMPSGALRAGEQRLKGWIPVSGGPDAETGSGGLGLSPGGSLWYFTPVYREGDANCCPSANASLWLEARPRAGRFEPGLLLRAREDSVGNILGVDTLHR
jgi:hypothetical protein